MDFFLPEWAPNIHPLIVHFPIGLLFTAAFLDIFAFLLRKFPSLRISAVAVYTLGAFAALVTYLTGQQAGDAVMLAGEVNTILTDHADWAEWTLYYFGAYAVIRLGMLWLNKQAKPALWLPVMFLGFGGLFLVFKTSEQGARMVFEHGVGVKAVGELESQLATQQGEIDRANALAAGPVVTENGSWRWVPNEHVAGSLNEAFEWLEGDSTTLVPEALAREDESYALRLQAEGSSFLVFDRRLGSMQADLTVNIDQFDGTLTIAHHVRDAENYHFLALNNGMMRQGVVTGGLIEIMDEKPFEGSRWQQLRVVADKTHFRGYGGSSLVTHGHGDAPDPGSVGLRIDGTGTLLIDRMEVQVLRPEETQATEEETPQEAEEAAAEASATAEDAEATPDH